MIKQVRFPSAEVGGYVRSIVVLEYANEKGDLVLPLVTNGSPSIVFLTSGGAIDGKAVGSLTVFGHNRGPFSLALSQRFTLIAFFLHPYCLPELLGIGAGELTDRYVGLDLLRPMLARTSVQQLLEANSLDQRFALMDRLVLRLAGAGGGAGLVTPGTVAGRKTLLANGVLEKAQWATRAIQTSHGQCSLVCIQKELGLSERGLQRLFETCVGLTPRMYGRIRKFDAVFHALGRRGYARLSDIAYGQGYADQSHFIRAFKEFTGFTPGEYLGKAAPYME